jgi:carbonic anhydrase
VAIQQLVAGIHYFQSHVVNPQRAWFEHLADGQNPQALFITCSDSRIDPNLITQTAPGDLFILRNAGNLIPSYGTTVGGELATIEFAVTGLGVTDIIVCGHSHCGAMKALLQPQSLEEMPSVAAWLMHAEATRRIVKSKYGHLTGNALLEVTIEENVVFQLEHLQTHPAVAVALAQNQLRLHAWVYEIESGEVYSYDTKDAQFRRLSDIGGSERLPPRNTAAAGDGRFQA